MPAPSSNRRATLLDASTNTPLWTITLTKHFIYFLISKNFSYVESTSGHLFQIHSFIYKIRFLPYSHFLHQFLFLGPLFSPSVAFEDVLCVVFFFFFYSYMILGFRNYSAVLIYNTLNFLLHLPIDTEALHH